MNNDSLYNSLFQLLSVPKIQKYCVADSIENSRIDEMSRPEMTPSDTKLDIDIIPNVC